MLAVNQWKNEGWGRENSVSTALNVFGLLLNLGGVLLLFLFGMPMRVASGDRVAGWALMSIDLQTKKFGDLYSVLSWMGLGALVLGTLLRLWATVERR